MRGGLIACMLAWPGVALAQTLPPECHSVHICFDAVCDTAHPVQRLTFADVEGGMMMTNPDNPGQTMVLTPVPGDGPATWVGRSPRTPGVVMITRGAGARLAMSVHNTDQAVFNLSAEFDCAPVPPSTPTK